MEEDQSGPEKQDQAEEEQQQPEGATQQVGDTTTTAATAVRSYECNFCKRGFTNAQALGGHMNIHRKDKAKLKQSANPDPSTPQPQNFPPSLFLPPPTNIFGHNPCTDHLKVGNWPFPSSKDTLNSDITPSRDHIITSKSSIQYQQGKVPLPLMLGDIQVAPRRADIQNPLPAAEPELDLELRLGHNIEPASDHSSSTNTTKGTTRKFF